MIKLSITYLNLMVAYNLQLGPKNKFQNGYKKMNLNHLSNTALFRLYVEKGDNEAISLFFQNQSDLFYRVALKYTKNGADAEDVLQTAFIRISEKANQYKGLQTDEEKLLQSWCLSVVVNCAIRKNQAESNHKRKESNFISSKLLHEEENMASNLDQKAIYQKVQEVLVQLPEKFRIPIHLKYVEGFELEAISNILKLNANTLRSNIKRGLERISEELKEDNITLSSIGLVGVLESLPLEKAPLSVKNFAIKNFNSAKSSHRLLAKASNTTFVSSPIFYASLAITCLAIGTGIFYWKESNAYQTNSKNSINNIAKGEVILPEETNRLWSFNNEKDRDLIVRIGKWEWSDQYKSMFTSINKWLLISLPIKPQQKPFVIEILMAPNLTNGEKNLQLNSEAFWVLNNHSLEHLRYYPNEKKLREAFYTSEFKIKKIYFYKNYICTFVGDRCYAVNEYRENIEGANIAFLSLNFMLQKIKSTTFDTPPKELLEAIESKNNLSSVVYPKLKIEENNIDKD